MIMNIYNELDNYVMSLNSDIKKNTTSVYLSYYYGKNFIYCRTYLYHLSLYLYSIIYL